MATKGRRRGKAGPGDGNVRHSTTGVDYYYEPGKLVVWGEALDEVAAALRRASVAFSVADAVGPNVEVDVATDVPIDELVEDLGDLPVEPMYVLLPANHLRGYGAARPRPRPKGAKVPRPRGSRGEGVTIGVVDVGFYDPVAADQPSWMSEGVSYDQLEAPPARNRIHDATVGHGNAVVGIIRQLAPGARVAAVTADTVPGAPGATTDRRMADAISRLLDCQRVHVLVIPMGGSTRHGVMPFLEDVLDRHFATTAVYAAAGNDGLDPTIYPAVDPGVIGVAAWAEPATKIGWTAGACRAVSPLPKRPPAPWSNRGLAASLGASGVQVPAPFVKDALRIRPGGGDAQGVVRVEFDGWAEFTGTSFAAAVAAACDAPDYAPDCG